MICTKCFIEKPPEVFAKDKRMRSGCSSWCKACHAEKNRAYKARPEYAGQCKQYNDTYYEVHHDEVRERQVESRLKQRYGITLKDHERMRAEQNQQCKICQGSLPRGRNTHVDHDHATGEVRGLLCARCNFRLGVIEDREWVAKAEAYLQCVK